MKVIIDIPEEVYEQCKDIDSIAKLKQIRKNLTDAVKYGTPLPKGHGDLIDAKEVYRKFYSRCLAGVAKEVLEETSTIIPADKEERQ